MKVSMEKPDKASYMSDGRKCSESILTSMFLFTASL